MVDKQDWRFKIAMELAQEFSEDQAERERFLKNVISGVSFPSLNLPGSRFLKWHGPKKSEILEPLSFTQFARLEANTCLPLGIGADLGPARNLSAAVPDRVCPFMMELLELDSSSTALRELAKPFRKSMDKSWEASVEALAFHPKSSSSLVHIVNQSWGMFEQMEQGFGENKALVSVSLFPTADLMTGSEGGFCAPAIRWNWDNFWRENAKVWFFKNGGLWTELLNYGEWLSKEAAFVLKAALAHWENNPRFNSCRGLNRLPLVRMQMSVWMARYPQRLPLWSSLAMFLRMNDKKVSDPEWVKWSEERMEFFGLSRDAPVDSFLPIVFTPFSMTDVACHYRGQRHTPIFNVNFSNPKETPIKMEEENFTFRRCYIKFTK